VNIISIDWSKMEERPDKKISVEGKNLLELRSEIKDKILKRILTIEIKRSIS
jgi:hypothetical protein